MDIGTAIRYVHATDEAKRRAVEAAAVRRGEELTTSLPRTIDKIA